MPHEVLDGNDVVSFPEERCGVGVAGLVQRGGAPVDSDALPAEVSDQDAISQDGILVGMARRRMGGTPPLWDTIKDASAAFQINCTLALRLAEVNPRLLWHIQFLPDCVFHVVKK